MNKGYRDRLSSSTDPFTRSAKRSASRRAKQYRRPKGSFDYFSVTTRWRDVRFIKGEYEQEIYDEQKGEILTDTLPYYEVYRHWDNNANGGKGGSHICSAGINDLDPQPCVGCTIGASRKAINRVFTVVHLAWYHKIPLVDRDTKKIVKNRQTGETVMISRECEGKNCPMCASADEKYYGRKLHLSLGITHFNQLVSKVEDLNATCKCGGDIEYFKFVCPSCEKLLIDLDDKDCPLSQAQVEKALESGFYCPDCGYNVDLLSISECEKCNDPKPVGLFDVDVSIKKLASTQGDKRTTLDVKFSDPGDLAPAYEGDQEPLDLATVMAPMPVADQKEAYGYKGPVNNADGESESYGD